MELDESEGGEIIEVRGNSCKKGEEFARQEHIDPRRLVTTTVAVDGALWPRLPVKTTGEVPKMLVREVCRACLLYTSDAADERSSVDLGGRRIIKKKTRRETGCLGVCNS